MSSKIQDLTAATTLGASDVLVAVVDPAGTPVDRKITFANFKTALGLSGTNTGDQTISLTGHVTGSGTGSFATTIAAGVVTNAMLAGSIAYSKLSLTGAILNADLAGSIAYSKLSLTGAILNADLAGSIAASKLVGTDITTVGTITTGGLGTGAVVRGVTMTLGSDANYDMYYRNSSGVLTRLANGSTGTFLGANTGAAPSWQTPSGGGGSPGGSDTQFQYNDGGAFGGVGTLAYDDTTGALAFTASSNVTQLTFKAHASQSTTNPFFKFLDSAGSELGRLHFRNDNAVSLGFAAGDAITSGAGVYIGRNAGGATTSTENVAIGNNALIASNGGENTVVGNGAANGVSGSGNTIVGSSAGGNFTSANNNTAVGSGALTGSNGDGNTAIGTASLESTSGQRNVGLGHKSGCNITSGSWNINIGAYVTAPTDSGSGQINIGNVLFGRNAQSSASASGTPTGSGVIGIGVVASDTARLLLAASTTAISSLRVLSGTAPTSPVDGDIWFDGTNIKMQVSGTTKTFTLI